VIWPSKERYPGPIVTDLSFGEPASVTPLLRLKVPGGDVLRALRIDEPSFIGFGEAYATTIDYGVIKSWRRNLNATANLIVLAGSVRFISSIDGHRFDEYRISPEENFLRLTLPAGCWFAFQGLSQRPAVILNILSCLHDHAQIERKEIDEFSYIW